MFYLYLKKQLLTLFEDFIPSFKPFVIRPINHDPIAKKLPLAYFIRNYIHLFATILQKCSFI